MRSFAGERNRLLLSNVCHMLLLLSIIGLVSCDEGYDLSPRIIGGAAIPISEASYTVAVYLRNTDGVMGFRCGGVIITPASVLTSAQCTDKIIASNLWINAGSADRTVAVQLIQVSSFKTHENFNRETFENDITVLRLTSNIVLGVNAATVTLPAQDLNIADGTECSLTGWGRLGVNGPVPVDLRLAKIKTISNTICAQAYVSFNVVRNTMVCAGDTFIGGVGACEGDTGGPLVHNGILLGISSWGVDCGHRDKPSVFTRIPSYRNWIINAARI